MSFTVIALVAPWVAIAAQRDTLAAIDGAVSSSFNGHALSGVRISVPAVQRFVVTDSTGRFVLGQLPAGKQKIRISYVERQSDDYQVTLHSGKTTRLAVFLDLESFGLAPVVVEGRDGDGNFTRSLAGFYDRKGRAFGTFFTLEEIERIRPARLSSLLRLGGISMRCRGDQCVPYTWTRSRACLMGVYLDGMPTDAAFLDSILPEDVVAVEVYSRGVHVPPEFGARGVDCGLVAVWSRA